MFKQLTATLLAITALSYWYQCALGVQILHQNDIIHRDMKPANLSAKTYIRNLRKTATSTFFYHIAMNHVA